MALIAVATVHIGKNTQYISKCLCVRLPRGQKTENLITHKNRQLTIDTIAQWVQSLDCELEDQEIVVVLPVKEGEFVVFPSAKNIF